MAMKDYTGQIINTANMYQPATKKPFDWKTFGDSLSDMTNNFKQQEEDALLKSRQEALSAALQGGDEKEIAAAYAEYNPQAAMAQRLEDNKLSQQFKNQMALLNQQYQNQRGLEALKNTYSQQAQQRKDMRQAAELKKLNEMGLQLTGNKTFDEAMLKAAANEKQEEMKSQREAGQSYDEVASLYDDFFGKGDLIKKAQIDSWADRKTPNMWLGEDAQTARQMITNALGNLRLDSMQSMKGAISDKEQEFLSKLVSDDISSFTPAEIKGSLASIMGKLKKVSSGKYGVNDPLSLR